ncbi:homeobox protein 2-like [Stegodyphus dumicola]|uniref:homeobox protein 2-like n=1 Tax=Stegodyphus dumicola TaxID=202533 RepID=UPI0015AC4D09|nr:homeobox protein 2-like [Stegodyphus dumicola]
MYPIILCQRNIGPVNTLKGTEKVHHLEDEPSKRNYRTASNLKNSDERKSGYYFSDNPRKSVAAEDDIQLDEHDWDSFVTQVEAPEVKDTVREKTNKYKQDSTSGRSLSVAKNNKRSRKSNAKSNSKEEQVKLSPNESELKVFNISETEIRNLSKQAAEHSFISIPPPEEKRKYKNTHTDTFRRKVDDILSRNGEPRSRLVKFGRRQFRNVPKRIVKHRSLVSKPQVLNHGILRGNSVGQHTSSYQSGTPKDENGKLTTSDQTIKEVPSHDTANYNAHQFFPDLSGGTNAGVSVEQSVNGKEQNVESLKEAGDTQKVTIVKEKSVHSTSTEEEQERVNIESNPSNERFDSEKLIPDDHHIPIDVTENHQIRKQDETVVLVEGAHIPGKNYGPEDDTFGYYSESYKPDQPSRLPIRRKVKIVKVVKPRVRNQIPQNAILNNHGNGLSSQYIIRNHNDNLKNGNFRFNNNHQPLVQPGRETLYINHNINGRGQNIASDRASNHVVLLQDNRQHQILNDDIKPPVFHQNQNQEFNTAPQQVPVNLENKLHGHLLEDGQQAFHSQSRNRNQVYIQLINTPEDEKRVANSNLNQKEEFKGPKTVFFPNANRKENPLIVDNVQLIQVIHPQSEQYLHNHGHENLPHNRNVPNQRTVIHNQFISQQPEKAFNNGNENIGYIEIPVTHLQQLHISPEVGGERAHTHPNNEGHISVQTAANNQGTGEQAYILLCDQNTYSHGTNAGQFGEKGNIEHSAPNVNNFGTSGIVQNVDHYKGSEYELNSSQGTNKNTESVKTSEQDYNLGNSAYDLTFNTQTNDNHFKGTPTTLNDHNQGNFQGSEYSISEDAGVTNLAIPIGDSEIQHLNHGSAKAQGHYKGTDLQNPQREQLSYKGQDFPELQGQNKALGIGITVHNSGKNNAGFGVPQHQGTYDGHQQNSNIHQNSNFENQQSYDHKNPNNILIQTEGSYGQQLPQPQGHLKGTAIGDVNEQGYSQQNHEKQNINNGKALGIGIAVHASGNTGVHSEDIQNHGNYNNQQKNNLNGHYKGSDFSQQNFGHNQQNTFKPQYGGSGHVLIQPQGEFKGTGHGISHGSGQQQPIYKSIEHQDQNNAKALGIGIALHTAGNDNLNFGAHQSRGNNQEGNLNSHYKGTDFIQQQSYGFKKLNNPIPQTEGSVHGQGISASQGSLKSTGEAIIYDQQQYKNSGLNTGTHNQRHATAVGFGINSGISPSQGFYNGNSLSDSRGISFKQRNFRSNRQTPFAHSSGDSSFNQGKGSFQNPRHGFTKTGTASGKNPAKLLGNKMPYGMSYAANKNLQQSEFLQYESLKPTHSKYQIEEPIDIILVEEDDNSYQNSGGSGEDYYHIQQDSNGNSQNSGTHHGSGDFYNVENSNIEQQHSNVKILVDGGKDRTYPIRQLATVGLHVARNVLPHVKKSRAKSITGNINFGVEIKKGGNAPQNSQYNIESRNDAVNKTLE